MAPLSNPVDELFATLIGRLEEDPGFDVPAFLAAHSAHAPALRSRLERLRRVGLVGDARGESTLVAAMRERFGVQSEVRLPQRGLDAPSHASAEQLLPSRVIGGRYRILAEIGRGGMGRVFRALDLDLGRDVALKVADLAKLLPAADTAQRQAWVERFLTEAQVTAQLEHPSIVPVHDIGVDRAGELYYTMKLVEGETLEAKIEQWHAAAARGEPFPTTELLRIVIQACQAVAFAHERGVMHRDLKPSNVMVGRFGEVQVMDWGLAKLLGEAPETDTAGPSPRVSRSGSSTLAGEVLGTPSHMAPEQARGDPRAIGRSADVFGVGALLYHGLFGTPPNRPDGDSPASLPRKVPPDLEAICRRALHVEPGQRYESALALADDLQAFLDQRVVRAYEAGPLAELRKWVQRNRSLATAVAAAVLMLVAGLVTSLVLGSRAKERGDDVLRLSALRDLQELEAKADTLWPLAPELLPAYADWTRRADEVLQELPTHRRDLAARSAERTRESQWWAEQLRALVAGLERLQSGLASADSIVPEHGWSVPKRRAFIERLITSFSQGGEYAQLWDRALPALRAAYPALSLQPQLGLVPLGPDPSSGLWEFGHLQTGILPRRGTDGRLALSAEDCIVLVLVPGGTFYCGAQGQDLEAANYDPYAASDEGPVGPDEIPAVFVAKYELTQSQYATLCGDNPSYYTSGQRSSARPVERISFLDVEQALFRAGLRLPSEQEWEWAARAGTDSIWWTGDCRFSIRGAGNVADVSLALQRSSWPHEAWLDDGFAEHAPVGSFRPNPWGLHDTLGNLWEYCAQKANPDASSLEIHKIVVRGGCYSSTAEFLRSAVKTYLSLDERDVYAGVRAWRGVE